MKEVTITHDYQGLLLESIYMYFFLYLFQVFAI